MAQSLEFDHLSQFMTQEDSWMKYRRRRGELKTTVTWTLRSQLLAHIQFLVSSLKSSQSKSRPQVLFPFSAPGYEAAILAQLFPEVDFYCYDLRPFKVQESNNLHLRVAKFGTRAAAEWTGVENLYLIMNYRSRTWIQIFREEEKLVKNPREAHRQANQKYEEVVQSDMIRQLNLFNSVYPVRASLLVRFPYADDAESATFEYLQGYICYLPWSTQTGTETQLVVTRNKEGSFEMRKWVLSEYEGKMFYHNSVRREKQEYLNILTHDSDSIDPPELLSDYDSNLEIYILASYIWQRQGSFTPSVVRQFSQAITRLINQQSNKDLNLYYLRKNKIPEEETIEPLLPEQLPVAIRKREIPLDTDQGQSQLSSLQLVEANLHQQYGQDYSLLEVYDDPFNFLHAIIAATDYSNYSQRSAQDQKEYARITLDFFLQKMPQSEYNNFVYAQTTGQYYSQWFNELSQLAQRPYDVYKPGANSLIEMAMNQLGVNILILDPQLETYHLGFDQSLLCNHHTWEDRKLTIVLYYDFDQDRHYLIYKKPNIYRLPNSDPLVKTIIDRIC